MQRVDVLSRHLGTHSAAAAKLPAKSASGQAAAAEVRTLLCTPVRSVCPIIGPVWYFSRQQTFQASLNKRELFGAGGADSG